MFEFRNGSLHAESVPLEAIAREFGTPCYVYSRAALAAALTRFQAACGRRDVLVCYAMKANSNLAILELVDRLAAEGISLRHLDLGVSLDIRYRDETPPDVGA